MIVTENWLREWLVTSLDVRELAERLTLAGLEVAGITPVAPPLDRVVVGAITKAEPHPNADQLQVCRVDVGRGKALTIVCGAPNARPGLRAPVALPGAVLPGGREITDAVVRGVASSGMLCSAAELGLEETASGLLELEPDARPGTPLFDYLELHDQRVEIELTPNRGDCLSVAGVARELAALAGGRLKSVKIKPPRIMSGAKGALGVRVAAKKDCPRYVGQAIHGIDPTAVTPLWMKERLRRCGVRSIHPVVDVTNYVMLELGQPMHAFDLDTLAGGIEVRAAREGETLKLLDGSDCTLDAGSLLIADRERPLALAGVMGGLDSAVRDSTVNIFLESAFFRPEAIARGARRYGLHTDSSHRFERGVDPGLQRRALDRAAALLVEIVGGEPQPVQEVAIKTEIPQRLPVLLRRERIATLLGAEIPPGKVTPILTRLGMQVKPAAGGWRVTPPSYRFDISREADLIEEVARVYGYDRLPSAMPSMPMQKPGTAPWRIPVTRLRQLLVDRDYQEIISYSFVDPELQALIDPDTPGARLTNPIASNMAVMRTTLWPGLIEAVRYNRNRQQTRIRLFETGRRFRQSEKGAIQEERLAGVALGPASATQWGMKGGLVDFYDVKGDIEALLTLSGRSFRFRPARHPALHPGQTAEIVAEEGAVVGLLGALHPALQTRLELDPLYLFELDLAAIQVVKAPIFRELSRFPSIRRDLALVVDRTLPVQTILDEVAKVAGNLLVNLELFDEYRGEGIDSGRKSLAMALTLQDTSRTLKEEAVDAVVANVIMALTKRFGAQLRQ